MPKFSLGTVVTTPGALEKYGEDFLANCLARHIQGDWGDICDDDKRINDLDLKENCGRLMSSYKHEGKSTFLWIITEVDRSVTTFLLPEEY